ncbi:MAG: thioredoxin family protein [Candidatus Hodarchaeota archaeon]
MPIKIDNGVLEQVKSELEKLEGKVKVLAFFTEAKECKYCNQVVELAEIVADLSDKITVEPNNCEITSEKAAKYGIDKYPALLIHGRAPYKIRFFGIPAGYEFRALVSAIVDASRGTPILTPETQERLFEITQNVHIQVFVTPSCPYCVSVVRMAHQFAIMNSHITADMIEVIEFRDLAQQYKVKSVPKIIINDKIKVEGAIPEERFLAKILEAIG